VRQPNKASPEALRFRLPSRRGDSCALRSRTRSSASSSIARRHHVEPRRPTRQANDSGVGDLPGSRAAASKARVRRHLDELTRRRRHSRERGPGQGRVPTSSIRPLTSLRVYSADSPARTSMTPSRCSRVSTSPFTDARSPSTSKRTMTNPRSASERSTSRSEMT